jgi:hypothetical protein
MKNLLLFLILLFIPFLCNAQIKISLGESRDSISIPMILNRDGTLNHLNKGHSLYSWKNKQFNCHLFKLGNEFFLHFEDQLGFSTRFRVTNFTINSCEINVEGIEYASGNKFSFKEECGVLIRLIKGEKLLYSFDYYRSFSDVIFKDNVYQYFKHNLYNN